MTWLLTYANWFVLETHHLELLLLVAWLLAHELDGFAGAVDWKVRPRLSVRNLYVRWMMRGKTGYKPGFKSTSLDWFKSGNSNSDRSDPRIPAYTPKTGC